MYMYMYMYIHMYMCMQMYMYKSATKHDKEQFVHFVNQATAGVIRSSRPQSHVGRDVIS